MKLRIQGNSIRLRVTQSEIAQLRHVGRIESSLELTPGRSLSYAVEASLHARSALAVFDGRTILVSLPAGEVNNWVGSEQIGIEGGTEAGVQILVEKDFPCRHKPAQADSDSYPDPPKAA